MMPSPNPMRVARAFFKESVRDMSKREEKALTRGKIKKDFVVKDVNLTFGKRAVDTEGSKRMYADMGTVKRQLAIGHNDIPVTYKPDGPKEIPGPKKEIEQKN